MATVRLAPFAIVAVLIGFDSARASQVHYEDTSLAQLVEASQLILVIEPTSTRRESAPLPKGRRGPEPFTFSILDAKVIEVLHGSYSGDKIAIAEADLSSSLHVHALYYLDGTSKSPIYERYTPAVERKNWTVGRQIVFLRKLNKPVSTTAAGTTINITRLLKGVDYAFVMHGAHEAEEQAAAVRALLPPPKP